MSDILPIFSAEDLTAARNGLRISPAVTMAALKKLKSATASVGQIERLVSLDATLAGQVIKAANTAVLPFRDEARSRAILTGSPTRYRPRIDCTSLPAILRADSTN